MEQVVVYLAAGVALVAFGLYAVVAHAHLLRKVIALNVLGAGVFMVLMALAAREGGDGPDPVPHALVLTGIVVAVATSALAIAAARAIHRARGRAELEDDG